MPIKAKSMSFKIKGFDCAKEASILTRDRTARQCGGQSIIRYSERPNDGLANRSLRGIEICRRGNSEDRNECGFTTLFGVAVLTLLGQGKTSN